MNELKIVRFKGHVGNLGNDLVDAKAKSATSLRLLLPVFPKELWQVSFEGELVDGPRVLIIIKVFGILVCVGNLVRCVLRHTTVRCMGVWPFVLKFIG